MNSSRKYSNLGQPKNLKNIDLKDQFAGTSTLTCLDHIMILWIGITNILYEISQVLAFSTAYRHILGQKHPFIK